MSKRGQGVMSNGGRPDKTSNVGLETLPINFSSDSIAVMHSEIKQLIDGEEFLHFSLILV